MANIDYLIHNSTKKILSLVKSLPDREKIESAVGKSKPKKVRRFMKHPRNLKDCDHLSTDEEDTKQPTPPTTAADCAPTTIGTHDALKNSHQCPQQQQHARHKDSSDEYCDVTVRHEENYEPTTLSTYLKGHCCHDDNDKRKPEKKKGRRSKQVPKTVVQPETANVGDTCHCATDHITCDENAVKEEQNVVAKDNDEDYVDAEFAINDIQVYIDPKLRHVIERCGNSLKDCRLIFECGIEPPDGLDDYERRKRRTGEFSSRLSRNYLYQLNRTILDIDRIMHPAHTSKKNRALNSLLLGQRFFNAYQTLYLALEAYNKHLPASIVNGMPHKLREVIDMAIKVNTMFRDVSYPPCDKDCALEVFDTFCHTMLEDECLKPRTCRDTSSHDTTMPRPFRHPKRNTAEGRLSMYTVPLRKDALWKKAVAALAKKKYQVASKYKTAQFKHRPPLPPQHPAPPPPLKLHRGPLLRYGHTDAHRRKLLKSSKYSIVDMDNITTYVQDDAPAQKTTDTSRTTLRRHAQSFFEKVVKADQVMTEVEYHCILDHFNEILGNERNDPGVCKESDTLERIKKQFGKSIRGMQFDEFVGELVCYANSKAAHTLRQNTPNSGCDVRETILWEDDGGVGVGVGGGGRELSGTISVTGPSNAKLICMREYSDTSDPQLGAGGLLERINARVPDDQEASELIYHECSDMEDVPTPLRQPKLNRLTIKKRGINKHLSMRKKTTVAPEASTQLAPLRMLPRETMIPIIEYKLLYHKEAKNSHMYRKTDDVKPWVLVERVADALMEETLLTVTRDIQVDQILKKIYKQEFK